MKFEFLTETYSICRLDPEMELPTWCTGSFMAMVRTPEELSIVVASDLIPEGLDVKVEQGFCCLRVIGELEFDVIGVIAKISKSLADVQIPILSISTFNTDYFLLPNTNRKQARSALERAGFEFSRKL